MSPATDRPLAGARWLASPESRAVMAALTAGGYAARFVGGCVRDTLLDPDLDGIDLDIATQLTPDLVVARLAGEGIKVVPTGIAHGTITALVGRRSYEITTLRRDVATDGRRATVAFSSDFDEDAARRDFTINALSCDVDGRLFDPFSGRADLAAGRIRFVGAAATRIREDYLRILRFFRFYARFGHPPADPEALNACRSEATGIDGLSGERLRAELLKLLMAPGVLASLALMIETRVAAHVLPVALRLDCLRALLEVAPEADALLRLAALVRAEGTNRAMVEGLAERLRLSVAERERLVLLTTYPLGELGALVGSRADAATHERAIMRLGFTMWRDLAQLAGAERKVPAAALAELIRTWAAWPLPVFPIKGADVLRLGLPPGPQVGRLLAQVRDWWEAERYRPDRDACLARLAVLAAVPAAQIAPGRG